MQIGQKGCIVKVKGHGSARRRAVDAGLYNGIYIEVLEIDQISGIISLAVDGERSEIIWPEASMIEVLTYEEAAYEQGVNEVSAEALKELAHRRLHQIDIALVGQPLSGKDMLFRAALDGNSRVEDDLRKGTRVFQDYHLRLVDLPDTYSLTSPAIDTSTVRRYLVDETPDVVISVVDATNLERTMQMTAQLLDMNLRVIVALNRFDAMQAKGARLDSQMLSRLLGTPVVPIISPEKEGMEHLLHLAINIYEGADFLDDEGEINKEVMRELQ